jgi:hypothetical protein
MHVSVCNLEMNDIENIVAFKLFKDDFSLALKNYCQADFPMENADEKMNNEIITKYISSCFEIEFNKSEILKLNYSHSEINEDAIWFYFSLKKTDIISHLRIKNTILLDLWDDQTNLLIFKNKGKENGYIFNRNNVEIEIDPES